MTKIIVNEIVNAPVAEVWKSWDEFGDIAQFSPNINKSYLLDKSVETGMGATRHCDLSDGKNFLREKIVEYVPNERLKIEIFDSSMPMKSGYAVFALTPLSADRTKVEMTIEMVPKMGIAGKAMMSMMKPRFTKLLQSMLHGNAAYVERGELSLA